MEKHSFSFSQGSRVEEFIQSALKNLKVKRDRNHLNRGFRHQEIEGLTLNGSDNPGKITLLLLDNNIVEIPFILLKFQILKAAGKYKFVFQTVLFSM